jgi:hypothetical protein
MGRPNPPKCFQLAGERAWRFERGSVALVVVILLTTWFGFAVLGAELDFVFSKQRLIHAVARGAALMIDDPNFVIKSRSITTAGAV